MVKANSHSCERDRSNNNRFALGIRHGFRSACTSWDVDTFRLILTVLTLVAVRVLPKLQVAHTRGLTDKNQFDRENEARKALAQVIGGIFLLAGLYASMRTLDLQRVTFDLQQEGQITDRFTKAID